MAGTEKWMEFLQSFPCLWNPQDPDFTNEAVKEVCREQLLEICNVQSSLPVNMELLKQWLSANIVTTEFQGVTSLVQPSQSQPNQTLEASGVQQQNIMPDLSDLALEYPCLWNPKDPNYKNYSMRERCKRQLLAKCNSLSSTVITMCTLRRELALLCSRMKRGKKVSRTTKQKRSPVASQNGPMTAPAPPSSTELPQQIISPLISELPQQITSPLRSELPQQITSPLRSELPQQITSPLRSELPQQITSPLRSELPQQITSPLRSELPQQIISPPVTVQPQLVISALWSQPQKIISTGTELPQQIIDLTSKRRLPQQIVSPPGIGLPEQIIDLTSERGLPQQIIRPPGTKLPQIISSPGSELQQIVSPPGKLPQENISPPGTGLPQQVIDLTSGRGLPQQIIRPPRTELQQIVSPPSGLTSAPTQRIPCVTEESVAIRSQDDTPKVSDVLPQVTGSEITPLVPVPESEKDQNLPKKAKKKIPKSKKQKGPKSNENKKKQLAKPTLSTLAKEFPCLWHPEHPHYGFGAVTDLSLQLLLVKYNDTFPEKLTLEQLRKKMENHAQTILKNKTKNQASEDQQSDNQNTEGSCQPPSDALALLQISSDADEPLNYKHEEPQNQKTTENSTTEVTNPTTGITVPNTEITVPGTEITVPGTETTVPGTETTVPGTEITVPGTETTVPGTEITVPGTEITATDMDITMSEITPATAPLLVPETDQNSLKETEKNKTKGQQSQREKKKGDKETPPFTVATLIKEYPCLWDPEHPHFGFGAVKTLSLQLLLAKYNNVCPEKITLTQLRTKMRNLSKKRRKMGAKKALNLLAHNSRKLDYPKNQDGNIQPRTEETQPPPDRLTLFQISSDSSDSDEPLSTYKRRQPQIQKTTAPNTQVAVPNTEITITNREITVPDTEKNYVLNTESTVPNTKINVRNTEIMVPNTKITVPNTRIIVPNTEIILPNTGITVPNTGITVPNTGFTFPSTVITVPDTGITVPSTGITVPITGFTVPSTGITVPDTGFTVPSTGITVPDTGITVSNTGMTVPSTGITVPDTKNTIPNAVISFNWCRFCGEIKNDCTNVLHKNRTYMTVKKDCALHVNSLWFYVDFKRETLPNTICGDCDRKLFNIYTFVKHVRDVQETFMSLENQLPNQLMKRKSESVNETESKDGSGGKKFKITIDFNSDKLPTLSGDEDDCVEINCNNKTDSLRETDTDEVAKENCEVIDLSDDDIEMNPENDVPLLSSETELTNEVSESSKGVSNDISSQSQCGYGTNDNVINCTVEANSLSVTDTELENEVVKNNRQCVVPVNVISQLPCVNGNRWVEVSPMKKNDRDVNNEESERSEIGDRDCTQSCVDENDDDSLSATDIDVNEVDQPSNSTVPVDISSNNDVHSYKINGKDFIGICTDKGSHTSANKVSEQTDLNSHLPLDDANGAVIKYRHLLLDSLSLDTEKNNLVSVKRKYQLSSCNDDDLNNLNSDVETNCRLLLDAHPLNTKTRKISGQNPPNNAPSNNEDGRNNYIESKYRHLLLDSLVVSTESAKATEEKNNSVVSTDSKPHSISSSSNTDNGNNDGESKYKRLLLDSLSVDAESAEVNEQKNQRVVSVPSTPSNKDDDRYNGVGSDESETDSNDTDSYEKFLKGVLLQAIDSAGNAIRNSRESVKSIKSVGTETIVEVKKEVDDDITDKEV